MESKITITAVGDIFLGEHPVTLGHGVTSVARKKGPEFLFDNVRHLIKDSDIACANLEGIISPKLDSENTINQKIFWGDPSCTSALKNAGFNCLFLANNHTAQHGADALLRTCNLLDENEIQWTGFDPDNMGASKPARFEIKGVKISFLAYCDTQQYRLNEKILPIMDLDQMIEDIQQEKQYCDFLVFGLHWGDEFIDYPSKEQVETARALIDAGVNLIIGTHSHRLQGMEKYKNGLIIYSLGSFIKDLWPKKLRYSLILSLIIDGKDIVDYKITPIRITKNHRPEVLPQKPAERLLNDFDHLSKKISNLDLDQAQAQTWQENYENDVEKLLRMDRMSTALYYLTHVHRYDKRLLAQNVSLMVKRRLYKKNI
jgi:poly-gamma-glutamate synthesis protein (capsule biosynthesis protein)